MDHLTCSHSLSSPSFPPLHLTTVWLVPGPALKESSIIDKRLQLIKWLCWWLLIVLLYMQSSKSSIRTLKKWYFQMIFRVFSKCSTSLFNPVEASCTHGKQADLPAHTHASWVRCLHYPGQRDSYLSDLSSLWAICFDASQRQCPQM